MKQFVLLCSLLIGIVVVLFVVNQTAQAVMLAGTISPLFGRVVLYVSLVFYVVIILVPLSLVLRLPKPLVPPKDEHSSEYEKHLRLLAVRLRKNTHLAPRTSLDTRAAIEEVLLILDERANAIIKNSASNVFISTAVSQNGRLDAVMVLAAQTRLIWQIAHVYNQRPALQEFITLYANVAATLFAASQLDDLDVSEQIEPVIKAAVGGSIAALVPGISSMASIITQSVLEGTANAYLTLRVGVICQAYCRALTSVNRRQLRRCATLTAAGMLGSIVSTSTGNVIKAIVTAAKQAGANTVESAAAGIRGVGAKLNPFQR